MLEIIEEPKGRTYIKLIKYLCKNNNAVMFINRTDSVARILKDFDIICNEMKMNEEQLINEYKTNKLKNIFDRIRYNKEIFIVEDWIKERCMEQPKEEIIKIKQDIIKMIFENYFKNKKEYNVQKLNIDKIKTSLKPYLLKERHNPEWCGSSSDFDGTELPKYRNDYIYDICVYRISEEVEDFLTQSVNRLYGWNPPYLPQDICFLNNGYCQFKSITHEDIAYINLKSKEEYKHLDSIGVKLQQEYEGCYNNNYYFEKEDYIL